MADSRTRLLEADGMDLDDEPVIRYVDDIDMEDEFAQDFEKVDSRERDRDGDVIFRDVRSSTSILRQSLARSEQFTIVPLEEDDDQFQPLETLIVDEDDPIMLNMKDLSLLVKMSEYHRLNVEHLIFILIAKQQQKDEELKKFNRRFHIKLPAVDVKPVDISDSDISFFKTSGQMGRLFGSQSKKSQHTASVCSSEKPKQTHKK